jgi:DNA-binding protein YbaB
MRNQVDDLLAQFARQTEQLRDAQQAAAALTVELTSPDGLVRLTIDAAGTLSDLRIAPTAFERTKPDALARTITDLVQRGTSQVKQQAAELMRPLTEGLPDLSELVADAPSLAGLVPKIPDFAQPESSAPADTFEDPDSGAIMRRASAPPPPTPTRPARTARPDDDDMPRSWMIGDGS